MLLPGNNFEEEVFGTREERDARWEQLMLVKPHVVRGSTSEVVDGKGVMLYWVRYPRLVTNEKHLGQREEMGRNDAPEYLAAFN